MNLIRSHTIFSRISSGSSLPKHTTFQTAVGAFLLNRTTDWMEQHQPAGGNILKRTTTTFLTSVSLHTSGRTDVQQPINFCSFRPHQKHWNHCRRTIRHIQSGSNTNARCCLETKQPDDTASTSIPIPSPIVVIGGGGKMGTALIEGILNTDNPPRILASSRSMNSLRHLPIAEEDKFIDNSLAVMEAEIVIVSVKPKYAASVFLEIAPALGKKAKQNTLSKPPIVISVVAGFTTTLIQSFLSKASTTIPVVRTMPNIPASIGVGCTSICEDQFTSESTIALAESVMKCVGSVHRVSENLIPAATAIAGSGVAYFFMAAEAMADAGVQHGLDRKTAMQMAAQTIHGAGALLKEGQHPAILRNSVESPAGVTIAATSTLEEEGFRSALICAINAAVERQFEMEEEDDDE